jgi:hypothetical protein
MYLKKKTPLLEPASQKNMAEGNHVYKAVNPLTPELNPSMQRCLMRIFYWEFCFLNHALN